LHEQENQILEEQVELLEKKSQDSGTKEPRTNQGEQDAQGKAVRLRWDITEHRKRHSKS
jgi:hypothetical protein